MRGLIDWYVANYHPISIIFTLLVGFAICLIRFCMKNGDVKDLRLERIVSLVLTIYTIPMSVLLFASCFDISILSRIEGSGIYLIISGIALLYVAISSAYHYIKR